MMLDQADGLSLMVESSLILVGFSGTVTALRSSAPQEWRGADRLRLANLLATSLAPLFMSLLALVLLHASIRDDVVWRGISGIGAVVFLLSGSLSMRAILKLNIDMPRRFPWTGVTVVAASLVVAGLSFWNSLFLGAFWPAYVMLCSALAIGCFMFIRLIFESPR